MVDTGHRSDNVENIVDIGKPTVIIQKQVKTVANMYPGRVVGKDTNDHGMKVCDGVDVVPIGWLGHEQTDQRFRGDAMTDIQVVNNKAACLRGGGFCIRAAVPKGFAVRQGDYMFSAAAAGKVVPGAYIDGKPAMAIPFTNTATVQTDTNVDLISGQIVTDVRVFVETTAAGSSIDVGLGMGTESGFDADGFVDGEVCSAAEIVEHINGNATEASNTLGALLVVLSAKDANTKYIDIARQHICDGTCVSIDYTTADKTAAGRIFVVFGRNPGIIEVGRAEESVSTASAADDCWVLSTL
jgi:hypothetical protein